MEAATTPILHLRRFGMSRMGVLRAPAMSGSTVIGAIGAMATFGIPADGNGRHGGVGNGNLAAGSIAAIVISIARAAGARRSRVLRGGAAFRTGCLGRLFFGGCRGRLNLYRAENHVRVAALHARLALYGAELRQVPREAQQQFSS